MPALITDLAIVLEVARYPEAISGGGLKGVR
jgi:hypothetical protein